MELSNRHERVVPYLIFITSIMVCAFYMYKMMLPFCSSPFDTGRLRSVNPGTTYQLFRKISAHAIGTGGLLGGIMGVARIHLINPYWAFIIVILIAGLVGTSRIFLKKGILQCRYMPGFVSDLYVPL